jgi:hypothetical protein
MGEDRVYLFVDGSPERMALAYQRMSNELQNNTVWCKTVKEAIGVLGGYRERLYLVSMCHDLNEFVKGDTRREDGGMEIARWLIKSKEDWSHCDFVAHGHGSGDSKMVKRLYEAGFAVSWRRFGE